MRTIVKLRLLGSKSGELQEDVVLLIGNYIKDLLSLNERVEVVIGDDCVMDIELCKLQHWINTWATY